MQALKQPIINYVIHNVVLDPQNIRVAKGEKRRNTAKRREKRIKNIQQIETTPLFVFTQIHTLFERSP